MDNTMEVNSFLGTLRVLQETQGWLQKVEVRLLNGLVNRNDWKYENLEQHKKLFKDTPILVAYKGKQIGDGHNFDETPNTEDGTITPSFMSATAERIVGWFQKEEDIRIETIDGVEWIVGIGYIWKWYAKELVRKIEEQGLQGMSVSIETLITEMHKDGSTEVFTQYQILGTTILGDDVSPAVADANIRTLSALGVNEVRNMTLRVASEQKALAENNTNSGKNTRKGEKPMLKVKDLQAKLPDFKVLSADGETVALMSNKNEPYYCTAKNDENGELSIGDAIPVEKINFVCNESTVSVDAGKLFAALNAALEEARNAKDAECEAKCKAEAELEAMRKAETERRCKAVKAAMKARLDEINANRSEKISDNFIEDLMEEAKVRYYAGLEDKDGNFCGDIQACKEVDARCMAKILEEEKKLAEARANAARKRFAWDAAAEDEKASEGGVLAAFNRL